jgi:opacity protein-like surface antigen
LKHSGPLAEKSLSFIGGGLRKFAWLVSACTLVVLTSLVRAQEIDIAVGSGTLLSPKNTSASIAFVPPPARGGTYPSAGFQVLFDNHFGFGAEGAFRYHEGLYNGFQRFRPSFYDANGIYSHLLGEKTTLDLAGGGGFESLIFYNTFGTCFSENCPVSNNATHALIHAGAGVRYNFWKNVFIRPEANYYRIINNKEFYSGNILRLGASIGFSFNH